MVEFDIQMKPADLYDYNLHHAFTGASGILGEAFGAAGVVWGLASRNYMMVIIGALLLVYLPLTLAVRVQQTFQLTPAFKQPLHYVLDDEGMTIAQGEETVTVKWEDIVKAGSTGRSIFLYTSRVNATILPRAQMGDKTPLVIQCISTHMDPKRVKIRT